VVTDEHVLKIVNDSGFPLQIGLVEHIRNTAGNHRCHVLYTEHGWKNALDGNSGFIDIVVEYEESGYVFVIECKRVLGGTWVFLNPQERRRHAKLWVTTRSAGHFTHCGWADRTLEPRTPETQYCVVAHQDERKPLLERIASELISATEALAQDDQTRLVAMQKTTLTYASVIVTTAELLAVTFDASAVDLDTGKVAEIQRQEVAPYIRFRKQLSKPIPDSDRREDIPQPERFAYAKERTVFVVNAAHFAEFLVDFQLDDTQG
jgi:hypothetical protein